jgi:hypothetical protein
VVEQIPTKKKQKSVDFFIIIVLWHIHAISPPWIRYSEHDHDKTIVFRYTTLWQLIAEKRRRFPSLIPPRIEEPDRKELPPFYMNI